MKRNRLFVPVAVLLVVLFFVHDAFPDERHCAGNAVCIVTGRTQKGQHFGVQNLRPVPVTVTIYFTRLVDMRPDRELPLLKNKPSYTFVANASETCRAFELRYLSSRSDCYFMFAYQFGSMKGPANLDYAYRLPYESGKGYMIGQASFGTTHQNEHAHAVDFNLPDGTPVHAARAGIVAETVDVHTGYGMNLSWKQKTNHIWIAHKDGTIGAYEHIQKGGSRVRTGQRVEEGQVLGYSGNVGYGTGDPHLHFAVYKPVNGMTKKSLPLKFKSKNGIVRPVRGKTFIAE